MFLLTYKIDYNILQISAVCEQKMKCKANRIKCQLNENLQVNFKDYKENKMQELSLKAA